jgi:hypothetical protein
MHDYRSNTVGIQIAVADLIANSTFVILDSLFFYRPSLLQHLVAQTRRLSTGRRAGIREPLPVFSIMLS